MSGINKNIKRYRLQAGYTLLEVADKLGVKEATVQRYESGKIKNLKYDTIVALADIFNCTPQDLMGWEDNSLKSSFSEVFADQIKPAEVRTLPVLGRVACGQPIFADEEREYVTIKDAPKNVDFILIAKGDSMINTGIHDGDYVFIRKQSDVANGEIAVIIIENEATLKRVYRDPQRQTMTLVAENPAYAPIVLTGNELERVRILGKAICFQSDVK